MSRGALQLGVMRLFSLIPIYHSGLITVKYVAEYYGDEKVKVDDIMLKESLKRPC